MLHEAIFLVTCNAKNVALQVARKIFTCNTLFCNCNCCVASCKKSRTSLYFSQRCETSCLRVTSPLHLKGFLFVIVALQVARKIASCNMAFSCTFSGKQCVTIRPSVPGNTRKEIFLLVIILYKLMSALETELIRASS